MDIGTLRHLAGEVKAKVTVPTLAGWYGFDYGAWQRERVRCPACPPSDTSSSKNKTVAVRHGGETWKCYRCEAHGDVISWLAAYLSTTNASAIVALADKLGVTEPESVATIIESMLQAPPKASLLASHSMSREYDRAWASLRALSPVTLPNALVLFDLCESKGLEPKVALRNIAAVPPKVRSPITDALAQMMRLAPSDVPGAGYKYLRSRGLTVEDLFRRGGFFDDGKPYDSLDDRAALVLQRVGVLSEHRRLSLHKRMIVPIQSWGELPVALAGRSFSDDGPKWRSTRRSPVFDRNRVLFNGRNAVIKLGCPPRQPLIVVEGYMDAITLDVNRFPAVATMGTELTGEQARQIARIAKRVVIIPDNDDAGAAALKMSVLRMRARGIDVKPLRLECDVDEHLASGTAAALDLHARVSALWSE